MLLKDKLHENIFKKHLNTPFHFYKLEKYDFYLEEKNILCGDSVEFFLKLEDSKISEISFQSSCCSIAKVSTSILLEHIEEKTQKEIQDIISEFNLRLSSEQSIAYENSLDSLLELKNYPTRINCILLAWKGLYKIMEEISGRRI